MTFKFFELGLIAVLNDFEIFELGLIAVLNDFQIFRAWTYCGAKRLGLIAVHQCNKFVRKNTFIS